MKVVSQQQVQEGSLAISIMAEGCCPQSGMQKTSRQGGEKRKRVRRSKSTATVPVKAMMASHAKHLFHFSERRLKENMVHSTVTKPPRHDSSKPYLLTTSSLFRNS